MFLPFLRFFQAVPAMLVAAVIAVGCQTSVPDEVAQAFKELPAEIDYNFHVRPILADRCYQCHGPDENTRKAGLRLDIEEEAFARLSSGNYAFVRSSPARSAAFHRMLSEDPELVMPPPDAKMALSNREKAIIVKWIEQGAEWKPHWSFIGIEKRRVPEPVNDWKTINPVDNFIHKKLATAGLEPAPEADREHLLRRVTMDLTGLPPAPAEIEAFLADTSADAYEKVVDRLLASPASAERLAMEWMDIARYSDSHGVSFDGARNSWPYRDWLIGAFHQNMPFDEFITTQVAGDLMENPTLDQRIATSFYRMGQLEVSAGSIPEEFRVEYVAERTDLTGTAFLGLTVGCARCHDHKFDPISQKEFYQLSAFFNTTEEMGLGPTDDDRPPVIYLYDSAERVLFDSLDQVMADKEQALARTTEEITAIRELAENFEVPRSVEDAVWRFQFDQIEKSQKKKRKRNKKDKDEYEDILITDGNKAAEAKLGVTLVKGKYDSAAYFDDEYDWITLRKTGNFEAHDAFSVSSWIRTARQGKGPTQTILGNSKFYTADYRGWDVYLDSTKHLRVRLIHRLPDDYVEVMAGDEQIPADTWVHIGMTYDGSAKGGGFRLYINGEPTPTTVLSDKLSRTIYPIDDYDYSMDSSALLVGRSWRLWTFDVGLFEGAIDEINIFDREISAMEMAILGESDRVFTREERLEYLQLKDSAFLQARHALTEVAAARRKILDTVSEIMVMEEMKNPRKTYLLERGLYNRHGDVVSVGTPADVLPFSDKYTQNRLGLAQWLVDPENPLTSRVQINRYWQLIFGRGLVRTAEDFGIQGERPTHPELLDWLAAEFIESGWDLRHMLKLMVMSATYRQTSYASAELMDMDPENSLYARSPSYRWPAEFIRDNALAASGLLVKKVGGPPTRPYQPEGLWKELAETSYALREYKEDTLDNLYRRSIYTFQRRFMPPPFMVTFDASSREICQVRRENTSSPLQALTLLNDPQIVEASRVLSERMLEADGPLGEKITLGYRLATGIRPSANQLRLLEEHYMQNLAHFSVHAASADSLLLIGDMPWNRALNKEQVAAMTMVANTIFNYDDTYMKR